jgi:hypothetical protein
MEWTYVALLLGWVTARARFSATMAVTAASADVVNDDRVDLTTPLSHETTRSSIDARELAQRAAL